MSMKMSISKTTVYGIDLGDRSSVVCHLDTSTGECRSFTVQMNLEALRGCFSKRPRGRVIMEAGTHSFWVGRELIALGFDVLVADSRKIAAISKSDRKNDRKDAETLAELGSTRLKLLSPISPRRLVAQQDLVIIRARARLVEAETKVRNSMRGLVKPFGFRITKTTIKGIREQIDACLPEELRPAIESMLNVLSTVRKEIRSLDKRIESEIATRYAPVALLRGIPSIGPVTATTFVLTIDDPSRFTKSRSVGAYLGLVPRLADSGNTSKQLRISKSGDRYMRKLLVNCAQYLLGNHCAQYPDLALRKWGLERAKRGGPRAKKQAVVAVARKLAVLMHRMWVSNRPFDAIPINDN